jgi:thiamine biosynthesis lipoprotein
MSFMPLEFDAIGTHWIISAETELFPVESAIEKRIDEFDSFYSRFIKDSAVRNMGRAPGSYTLPADAKPLMDFYDALYKATDGHVTPLIGSTMEQAGYDDVYSFKVGNVQSPPVWNDALEYSFPTLTIKQPVVLDFGAAGKGYLADIIASMLQKAGYEHFTINAGGDIVVRGTQHIGLEDPRNTDNAIGVVDVTDASLCGSAGHRRKWGAYEHTINPKTLQSPSHIDAIWVIASSAMLADGLATALYFTDPAVLRKHFSFEYAIMKGSDVESSPGFGAEFFTA